MKRLLSLFLITALLMLPFPVHAASVYVIDRAGLLSPSEESSLEQRIDELNRTYQMEIVLLTVDSLNGKMPQEYADDYYDANGYGENGLLILLSMEYRDWYISTCGDTGYWLSDYAIARLGDSAVAYLSAGDYYGGFWAFLEALPACIDAQAQSDIYDDGGLSSDVPDGIISCEGSLASGLLLSLTIGLAAGGLTVLVMRSGMNTLKKQHSAGDYLQPGAFRLHTHRDLFLYSNITKVRRQEPSSSGGSSMHRSSSSGRSHGGGGGKF